MLLHRLAPTRCEYPLEAVCTCSNGTNGFYSDVLRRRFQVNTMSGMGYKYKSIFDAVRVITAQEGIGGLYKGISPNLLKVAPSMAASWLSFEMTRDYFLSLRPEEDDDI